MSVDTKIKFKDIRCVSCFERSYRRLFEKYKLPEVKQKQFMSCFDDLIKNSSDLSSPEIQRELSMKFCKLISVDDPFYEEKKQSNLQALDIYNRWKPIVDNEIDAFNTSLRLAIAGNIMDYGASDEFDIDSVVLKVLKAEFAIDDSSLLKEKIISANKILYLGDNAGEIVFDKLFIETNLSNKLTYVVKGGPVLNDVTLDDAADVKMDQIAKVISNGYNAPSTILDKSSKEFLKHYMDADLIISKGQGNLEGLINEYDERIFFLLMVKCDVIANLLRISKDSFVVVNGGKIREKK